MVMTVKEIAHCLAITFHPFLVHARSTDNLTPVVCGFVNQGVTLFVTLKYQVPTNSSLQAVKPRNNTFYYSSKVTELCPCECMDCIEEVEVIQIKFRVDLLLSAVPKPQFFGIFECCHKIPCFALYTGILHGFKICVHILKCKVLALSDWIR